MADPSRLLLPESKHRRHSIRLTALTILTALLLFPSPAHPQYTSVKSRRDSRTAQTTNNSNNGRLLEVGMVLRVPLAGGENNRYLINAPAGHYLRILVEQQGIDVDITLLSSNGGGAGLKVDNANGTRGTEAVSLRASASEVFRLEVKAREPNPKPSFYTIRIAEQHILTEEDGKRVNAERALAEGEALRAEGTLSSYNQALVKYEEAYQLWRSFDAADAALALLDMGKAHYFSLDMEGAIRKYGEALKLYEGAHLPLDEGVARLYIGMAKLALGENAEAFKYYERAFDLFTRENDERYVSFALNEIGRAYYLQGEVSKALEYYEKALPIRHMLNDRKGESFTLVSMGRAYSNGFDNDAQALELYQQALKLQREINNRRLIAQTLGDIGRLYYKAGDYHAALDYYNDALRAAENGDQSVKAEILMYIGLVYSAWGRHAEAIEQYFNEALRLQEGRDPIGRARTLHHIGRAYTALGNETKALAYLNGALEVWQQVHHRTAEADTRYNIALVESRRGRYTEACEQIKAALPIVESLRTGIVNRAFRAHFFASVQNYYDLYIDALMRLYSQTNDKSLEALALSVSESKRARAMLDVLIESQTDLRQTVSEPELLNREAAIQQEMSAQSLRQITGEHLTSEQVKKFDSLIAEFYEVEAEIRRKNPRYAALTRPAPPSIEQIQGQLLAPGQMLLEYSLGDERSYLWSVTATSVKSYVLPGRAEIEAAVVNFMKLLTARNESVAGETKTARDLRVERADARYRAAATALGKMLELEQVATDAGVERLLIVSDGELQYLPFAALLVPLRPEIKTDASTLTRQSFDPGDKLVPLLVYYETEDPPSMSVIAEFRREGADHRQFTPGKTIAVIADPVFSRNDERCCKTLRLRSTSKNVKPKQLPSRQAQPTPEPGSADRLTARKAGITDVQGRIVRLGFTRLEAEEILALFPAAEQLKAIGFDANLALITDEKKLASYRILHFATHGILNSEHPELSGILLSLLDEQGRPQNGLLQMHQIYNMHLPAEIVVLSACDTGISKNMRGEGLNGISRGFMYAGAKRVVASLWKVNDASTSQLMKYFYVNLRLGEGQDFSQVRPARALRLAQLEMMKQKIWRHPYFWAAFFVQGEVN